MKEQGNIASISVCMWCGEDNNSVMLSLPSRRFGKAMNLPRRAVFNPNPCAKCKTNMDKGFTCVEISPYADGYEIQFQCKMTGRWFVITEDSLDKILNDVAASVTLREQAKKKRIILFDTQTFEQLFGKAMSKDEQA